jgi:1,2-diacylglycerol-3-alpha-glucose alpha-1,2-galactosyltransferase
VFDYASVCVAISPQVKERLEQMKIRAKVVRINNPIDTRKWVFTEEKKLAGRRFLNLSFKDKVVLGVGQLQKRKGVEDFIQMARRNPHLKFVWVGGRPFGHLTEGIKRINEAIAKAPSNMTFTGLVGLNQMPLLYAASDIFVFPSYQENSPLAPIEAASCGLPIVFRNLDEYSKLYDSTYLAAETVSEISDHINRLALGGSFYKLGKAYSEQLVKQFDKEEVYQKLKALYESLIQDAIYEN